MNICLGFQEYLYSRSDRERGIIISAIDEIRVEYRITHIMLCQILSNIPHHGISLDRTSNSAKKYNFEFQNLMNRNTTYEYIDQFQQ